MIMLFQGWLRGGCREFARVTRCPDGCGEPGNSAWPKVVASLYPKKIGGHTYWYLREMARAGGRPKMVSERYLGTAAEIEALLDARESAMLPERTRHLAFGGIAAAWGLLLIVAPSV
jgi:hypothetical protein